MKKEIKLEVASLDYDGEKLNKLKDVLDNFKMKEIYNNIKSKDEMRIVYNGEKIELNAKFNFKVKSLRNRYYRQVLNLINIKEDINKKIEEYDSAIEKYNTSSIIFDSLPFLDKMIDSNNYKDILKIALINYIGVYNFDNIFELSKDEMLTLKEYKCLNNVSNYLTRLMGVYIPEKAKEKVFRALELKMYGSKLDEMRKCKNFILICPEIIQEFCVEHFNRFKEEDIKDIFELYTIVFDTILVHEIGHSVFEYTFDLYDNNHERRANYFSSLTFDGTFDKIIKEITRIQQGAYENPILITDDKDIAKIKEKIYNI